MHDAILIGILLFITVIILSTAFGKGAVGSIMLVFGTSSTEYLAEELSLLSTIVQYAPGEMEAMIKVNSPRKIKLDYSQANSRYELWVDGKIMPFLHNKDIGIMTIDIPTTIKGDVVVRKSQNQISINAVS